MKNPRPPDPVFRRRAEHRGAPQLIGKGTRTTPVFLTGNLLCYKSEGQSICGAGGWQPLVYDRNDGSESSSTIDKVSSVWPTTSSNF